MPLVLNEAPVGIARISSEADDTLLVTFNQALDRKQAETVASYALDGEATLHTVTLDAQQTAVTLATQKPGVGASYTLTVKTMDKQIGTQRSDLLSAGITIGLQL